MSRWFAELVRMFHRVVPSAPAKVEGGCAEMTETVGGDDG